MTMAAQPNAERVTRTNDPDRAPEVEVFYDGACPLCAREIAMLRRLDRGRGRIRFTDIATVGFDPASVGASWAALMREIHGRLPDGRLIVGVEVFRRLYAAVGFRALVAVSRWPVIAPALSVAYTLFARNRLRLTGRCDGQACAVHARSP
jgi:predicted DCC family thiol-disulfide oxidoreductase YuxK